MQRSRSYLVALVAVSTLALVAAACVEEADDNPLATGAAGDRSDSSRPGGGGGDGGGGSDGSGGLAGADPVPADQLDDLVMAAIEDLEAFWGDTFPQIYDGPFEPLAGGFHAYGPDTEPPPCGPAPLDYEEIAGNAFYCPSDDLIAWDEVMLIPQINETFGGLTVGIVFAHEFAHAIQARADVEGRTIDLELQADCFAGAWMAHVADGGSDTFTVSDRELDSAVAGMVAIRDAPGTDENNPMAHGSGFDRIGALQDGFENGAQQCADYEGTPRRTVSIPFTEDDVFDPDPGNLPAEDSGPTCPEDLDELVLSGEFDPSAEDAGQVVGDCGLASLLEADLNVFYDTLFEQLGADWTPIDDLVLVDPRTDEVSCGGETLSGDDLSGAAVYCQDENVVVIDGAGLTTELYEQIGDFAFGAEVSRLWAIAAQSQLGLDTDGTEQSLQADCMTGLYSRSLFPDLPADEPASVLLNISPGDLDEGIQGFLAFADADADGSGTAFERTEALRTGVVDGLAGCEGDYGELA